MSSGLLCRNCGSADIETDNARGDAVCTACGSVLEDSLIVSEIQFEEVGHGAAAIGQFVSSDSTGGATSYGKFQLGSGIESREVTIRRARKEIASLCYQLSLTQHYCDIAVNFFKMALMRHLTRGRKSTHIHAACVYITCRTEGTSHLLIDISDVQNICSYELGRTYLKLSSALCINIPSVDPCLYIMRFANKLQFGPKTHEVSNTALRIVQRMKKDSMHSGRRPSGLCGAALLIAARMHEYNRSIPDIVRIVKIHESTVRKRLTEFADTPSSSLTLDEFMSVDLEAEHDPPAFKAARKKDRERIKEVGEVELTMLQREIDNQLERDLKNIHKKKIKFLTGSSDDAIMEDIVGTNFIKETNMEVIKKVIDDESGVIQPCNPEEAGETKVNQTSPIIEGLKPDIEKMCLLTLRDLEEVNKSNIIDMDEDFDLSGLDDEEINNYILTPEEVEYKHKMWNALNAEYLKEMKEKEERLAKDREEGKPEKKKRKRKKPIGPSASAGEAIEKMLQEKKISSKINYDILKSLTGSTATAEVAPTAEAEKATTSLYAKYDVEPEQVAKLLPPIVEDGPIKTKNSRKRNASAGVVPTPKLAKRAAVSKLESPVKQVEPAQSSSKTEPIVVENDDLDDYHEESETEAETKPVGDILSLRDMLDHGGDDEFDYSYEDY